MNQLYNKKLDYSNNKPENDLMESYNKSNSINVFGKNENSGLSIPGYNQEFIMGLRKAFDDRFLSKLVDIYNTMSQKKIKLKEIDNIVEFIQSYVKVAKRKYVYSLLFPENGVGVRIPTKFPLPTATFKQKTFFIITPNSSGNFYIQWTPQTLLSSAFVTANQGDLLLNTSSVLTGSVADTTLTNYTPITTTRLLNSNLVQAYRVVSAALIISYQGSLDSHSGMLGGGLDVSFKDSTSPDTESSIFSNIDDKMWSYRGEPMSGMRMVYFPKDYSDLNFLRPDLSTQSNGLSTCLRLLAYGQNLPSGGSIKVELFRNFEIIPLPGMSDYVNMDYLKTPDLPSYSNGEPALEAGSIISENKMAITPLDFKEKVDDFNYNFGDIENIDAFLDKNKNMSLTKAQIDEMGMIDPRDMDMGEPKKHKHGFGGTILDIATWLGKKVADIGIKATASALLPIGGSSVAKLGSKGLDYLEDKIHNLYNK